VCVCGGVGGVCGVGVVCGGGGVVGGGVDINSQVESLLKYPI